MMKYRIGFDSIEWSSPLKGIRHKVYSFEGKKLRLVEYSSDMEPHWCNRGHAGYILEGRFQIEFAGCTEVFESGDGVFIPDGPDHRHRATVLSGTVKAVFIEQV